MLNEPILGVLPATEDQVLAAFPKVHPDPILRRLRRLEKAYVIEKMRDGRYAQTIPKVDTDLKPKPKGKSKLPVKMECSVCGKAKDRRKHFPRASKRCFACRPRRATQQANAQRARRSEVEA